MSALLLALAAAATEPLYTDPDLGRQMTLAEMRRALVGHTLSWDSPRGPKMLFVAPDGALKGKTPAGHVFTIAWHFRDYDNLFCADSGNPASSGCVQVLRRGDTVSFRRKDGLVEFNARLLPGNALGL